MGVFTLKRAVVFVVAVLFGANVWASNPSPRTQSRMAWDPSRNVGILFGGIGPTDSGGTELQHDSAETWHWTGGQWLQRFPSTVPPQRAVHSMVFDTQRNRVVMFGGRQAPTDKSAPPTFLNDTWVYSNDDWTLVESAEHPPVRQFAAMAYDRTRDRVVLYGGNILNADQKTFTGRYDTWEFDGAQWTQLQDATPKVAKPLLGYDPSRNQLILLGLDETGTTRLMFRFNAETKAWDSVAPTTLPTCVNDGHLVYRQETNKLLFFGGVCATGTLAYDEGFEWDGTNWTKISWNANQFSRLAGQAVAYDTLRREVISYGGTSAFGAVVASTTYLLQNEIWRGVFLPNLRPSPRSKSAFETDPVSNTIWMLGGLDETSAFYSTDFWGYRDGQWFQAPAGPVTCDGPLSDWDTDRNRMVVVCNGSEMWEWDGAAWKSFPDLKKEPDIRNFSALSYDPILKKTVLFGGYYNNNYRNDTWTWNGTEWTEVKVDSKKRPPNRGQHSMWYDPLLKKVVLYAGIGRPNLDERVTRYSDMWSFDGTSWTKLDVSATPGIRFGAQVGVNPVSGRVLLFGGLVARPRASDPTGKTLEQVYLNDTWEWNGAGNTWTQITPSDATPEPEKRENGSLTWDPIAQKMVLYAGYAEGFYRSDLWTWNGVDWTPREFAGGRRRAVR